MSDPVIFFAWVDASEHQFNPVTHARNDEDIFSFTITHEEGQIPTLDVVIRYPEVSGVASGLLNVNRKQWCWLSRKKDNGDIDPLFFGRIIGFPTNVSDILVPIRFHSRAVNYVAQKQELADSLRVRPFYDPIFFDDKALEDPENILEAWSASYHVSRTSLQWTISDILNGEDGTVTFDESDIIDGSVEIEAKGPPLRSVRVDATVHWVQNYRGVLIPVEYAFTRKSYSPQSFADAWPKVGASLSGGWVVAPPTFAVAKGGQPGQMDSGSGSWTDQSKRHNDGDAISANWSWNIPLGGEIIESEETGTIGSGPSSTDFLNTGTDDNGNLELSQGDSGGGSSSTSYNRKWKVIYSGNVSGCLWIKPDGKPNNFTETLSLTLSADVQALLTDPTSQEETEVIELQGVDVGEAVIDYKCMTTLSGQNVQAGQIMLRNLAPGPSVYGFYLALNSGTVGTVTTEETSPEMTEVVGEVSAWGGVDFAFIGTSLPTIMDWEPESWVRTGSLMCSVEYGGWFFFCDQGGFTGKYPPFVTIFGLPTPGVSTPGTRLQDGGVTWVALGIGGPSLHVPAQGLPGNITANSFFDKDRGAAAIEYMIMVARNKMRMRARAIEISFDTTFDAAADLSCRKNAAINVPTIIPGGWAIGKVIGYTLSWSGETGNIGANVRIGCAIGKGPGITVTPHTTATEPFEAVGTPTVAELTALVPAAQVMDGASKTLPTTVTMEVDSGPDVSYQPPPPNLTYNGFRFPITRDQVVLFTGWGSSSKLAFIEGIMKPGGTTPIGIAAAIKSAQAANADIMSNRKDGFYYEFQLRPISDQHTETPYRVNVSKLKIPKQIDLEA